VTTVVQRADERGQMLVELGVTMILFMFLSLGVVEFGRMLMIVNVVTHAARDGARAAAVAPAVNRNAGINQNPSVYESQVTATIGAVTTVPFTAVLSQPTDGGIPLVQVTVTANNGGVPWLFAPLLFPARPTNLPVTRTVRFRDEGR
jgi:Flp pilus assembly protein TadG